MKKLWETAILLILGIKIAALQVQTNKDATSSSWTNVIPKNLTNNHSLDYESNLNMTNVENYIDIMLIEHKLKSWMKTLNTSNTYLNKTEEYIGGFNRKKRNIHNTSECVITRNDLIQMKNEILNALHLNHSYAIENKCKLNLESKSCSALIRLIKCGIKYLKDQFLTITSNDISTDDVDQWKMKYTKLNKLYKKLGDDLNKTYDETYENNMKGLNAELENLKQIIFKLEKDLDDANKNIIQVTIELCSSEIHSKKIANCLVKIDKLVNINYTDFLNKIIHKSYMYIRNDNDLTTISSIIEFIKKFKPNLLTFGFEKLFEEMTIQKHEYTSLILTFATQTTFTKLNLEHYIEHVINNWSQNIINANYSEIIRYAEIQENSFCNFLELLITTVYSNNIINSERIIYFLDNLPTFKERALGYYTLYNTIASYHGFNGHEIIMLTYRIKEINENEREFRQLGRYVEEKIEKVISKLPSGIKRLLWDNYITIRSFFNNYKLLNFHEYFGFIYINTILAICPSSIAGADQWKVDAKEKGRYFKIKNTDSKYDVEYNWEVIAVNNGNQVYIKNRSNGRVLYTENEIGGWLEFWYSVPANCYQVYDDYEHFNFQHWLIS